MKNLNHPSPPDPPPQPPTPRQPVSFTLSLADLTASGADHDATIEVSSDGLNWSTATGAQTIAAGL